jgi:hypothetical protein
MSCHQRLHGNSYSHSPGAVREMGDQPGITPGGHNQTVSQMEDIIAWVHSMLIQKSQCGEVVDGFVLLKGLMDYINALFRVTGEHLENMQKSDDS